MMRILKFTLITAWFFLMLPSVNAQPVSRATALLRARAFMQGKNRMITQHIFPAQTRSVGDMSHPQYYIFNADANGGFVIVSGDERLPSILGYTQRGCYRDEEMPDNMRSWLKGTAEYIDYIQQHDVSLPQQTLSSLGEPIPPQTKSLWDQTMPYNASLPLVSSYLDEGCTHPNREPARGVTGCAATALAQVMYYWKYPAHTTAEIPGRTDFVWNSIDQKIPDQTYPIWLMFSQKDIPANTPIDWDNMIDCYYKRDANGHILNDEQGSPVLTGSSPQQDAIARLMEICSAAIQTKYGPVYASGSGANDHNVLRGAYRHLGFPNVVLREQDYYGYEQWIHELYEELQNAHAVFFTGNSTSGGHAFVIDGYDTEDLFSVNWGWSGDGNGYYRIFSLQPTDQGTGGAIINDGFRFGQAFLSHFYPNAPALQPQLYAVRMRSEHKKAAMEADGTFPVSLQMSVKNMECVGGFYAELGVAAVDDDGNIIDVTLLEGHHGGMRLMQYNKADTLNKYPIMVQQQPSMPKSYRLCPCFRAEGASKWKLADGAESIKVRVNDDNTEVKLSHTANLSLAFAGAASTNYTVELGQPFYYSVRLKVADGELHDGIVGKLSPPKGSQLPTVKSMERDVYYGTKGTEFDLHFTFPSENLYEGSYTLTLSTHKRDYDANLGVLTVTVPSRVNDVSNGIGGDAMHMDATDAQYDLNGRNAPLNIQGITICHGRKYMNK